MLIFLLKFSHKNILLNFKIVYEWDRACYFGKHVSVFTFHIYLYTTWHFIWFDQSSFELIARLARSMKKEILSIYHKWFSLSGSVNFILFHSVLFLNFSLLLQLHVSKPFFAGNNKWFFFFFSFFHNKFQTKVKEWVRIRPERYKLLCCDSEAAWLLW